MRVRGSSLFFCIWCSPERDFFISGLKTIIAGMWLKAVANQSVRVLIYIDVNGERKKIQKPSISRNTNNLTNLVSSYCEVHKKNKKEIQFEKY